MFSKRKKAQAVMFSVLIALFLFLLVLTFFFESLITKPLLRGDRTEILESEAIRLSDSLFLSGYPDNWEETNKIQKIGLTKNGILDINKINNLSKISNEQYDASKIYLGIKNDYFINITYTDESGIQTILIPNNEPEQTKYVVTKQRTAIIQTDNKKTSANMLIMVYSK